MGDPRCRRGRLLISRRAENLLLVLAWLGAK